MFDADEMADGKWLSSEATGVYVYQPDMSLHAAQDIAHARYFDITVYHVRAGHDAEWSQLVKLFSDAYGKIPQAHWAMYQSEYGMNNGGEYVLITSMQTLGEKDQARMDGKQAYESLGAEGKKKASDLEAACIESSQSNVFAVDPRMSYVSDDFVKADPGFWDRH